MANPIAYPKARAGAAVLIAAAVFVASFVVFGSMATDLIMLLYDSQAGNDPSAGDSLGWVVVFAAPLLVAVDIVVSLVGAMFAYAFSRRVLGAPPAPRAKILFRFEA